MALKYREEVVGKRFLALRLTDSRKSAPKNTGDSIASQDWLTGVIRAASERDSRDPELQVNYH